MVLGWSVAQRPVARRPQRAARTCLTGSGRWLGENVQKDRAACLLKFRSGRACVRGPGVRASIIGIMRVARTGVEGARAEAPLLAARTPLMHTFQCPCHRAHRGGWGAECGAQSKGDAAQLQDGDGKGSCGVHRQHAHQRPLRTRQAAQSHAGLRPCSPEGPGPSRVCVLQWLQGRACGRGQQGDGRDTGGCGSV
jgi:hypothetical protein